MLRFEILGPVRAFRDGEPIDLGPIKQRAVLAILLLNAGTPVGMPEIIGALWGGDPPENGVDVVQRFIGGLRRALDPARTSLIALDGGGYVIRPGANAVDAEVFRAALTRARQAQRTGDPDAAGELTREALALWRDEPLAGLTGPVFAAARARLTEERARLTDERARPTGERTRPTGERTRLTEERSRLADPAAHAGPVAATPASAHAASRPADPDYPEAVDPWAGHELFPPDPMSII
ncbi:BTAD domain-containing putative transcriptional regulator [Actinoplanes sp. NPDC023936]|uniref:AfsR/SARP family transcriptional regulator n=1 Tax=Actinoplanes sp. NPDC023936 TaxID=3154910 RepID=UPI0033D00041